MEFTYDAYCALINQIRNNGYCITDYYSYKELGDSPCCILRHDLDSSIEKAYELFEVEQKLGVFSTYFVLMSSNFYNPASKKNIKILREIAKGGNSIGLHFDEVAYMEYSEEEKKIYAEKERARLEDIIEIPVRAISMHRPSRNILEGNWKFQSMVNSYSEEFFHGFKYLSDSRRYWREPVEEIVESKKFQKLHILTHPFWYNTKEKDIHDSMKEFILHANSDRYDYMEENITDISSILPRSAVGGKSHE